MNLMSPKTTQTTHFSVWLLVKNALMHRGNYFAAAIWAKTTDIWSNWGPAITNTKFQGITHWPPPLKCADAHQLRKSWLAQFNFQPPKIMNWALKTSICRQISLKLQVIIISTPVRRKKNELKEWNGDEGVAPIIQYFAAVAHGPIRLGLHWWTSGTSGFIQALKTPQIWLLALKTP